MPNSKPLDVNEALRLVKTLEAAARDVRDDRIKKILLNAGNEIADSVLERQAATSRAA